MLLSRFVNGKYVLLGYHFYSLDLCRSSFAQGEPAKENLRMKLRRSGGKWR